MKVSSNIQIQDRGQTPGYPLYTASAATPVYALPGAYTLHGKANTGKLLLSAVVSLLSGALLPFIKKTYQQVKYYYKHA